MSLSTTVPERQAAIRQWLVDHCAEAAGIPVDELDPTLPFASYGLGSVQAVSLAGDLEEWLGCELPATLLWDYPTIDKLSAYLAEPCVA